MHCIYYNIDILICYKQSLFLFDKIIFPFRLNPNNAPSSSPREAFDSQVEYKQGYCLSPLAGFHHALQYRVPSCPGPAIQGPIRDIELLEHAANPNTELLLLLSLALRRRS